MKIYDRWHKYISLPIIVVSSFRDGRVMTERIFSIVLSSWEHHLTGLLLSARVRSSVIQSGLGVQLLLLHIERSELWFTHFSVTVY